jgi:hypothetical protein
VLRRVLPELIEAKNLRDQRAVDRPVPVEAATWSKAGQLDYDSCSGHIYEQMHPKSP